jgi:hypothetical protein
MKSNGGLIVSAGIDHDDIYDASQTSLMHIDVERSLCRPSV